MNKRLITLVLLSLIITSGNVFASVQLSELRLSFSGQFGLGNWELFTFAPDRDSLTDYNTGQATPIDFRAEGWDSRVQGLLIWPLPDKPDWLNANLLAAGGVSRLETGVASITFHDVSDGRWRIELISAVSQFDDGTGFIQTITANGQLANAIGSESGETSGVFGEDWDSVANGHANGNWLIWNNLTPVNRAITVRFDASQSGAAILNALVLRQTSAVPEPASLALAIPGILGLLAYHLRPRHSSRRSLTFAPGATAGRVPSGCSSALHCQHLAGDLTERSQWTELSSRFLCASAPST